MTSTECHDSSWKEAEIGLTVGRETEVEQSWRHEEYDPEGDGGGERAAVSDSGVKQQRISDGDVAGHGDAYQPVGTDRLQAEVDGDDRRTEHPVTYEHAEINRTSTSFNVERCSE